MNPSFWIWLIKPLWSAPASGCLHLHHFHLTLRLYSQLCKSAVLYRPAGIHRAVLNNLGLLESLATQNYWMATWHTPGFCTLRVLQTIPLLLDPLRKFYISFLGRIFPKNSKWPSILFPFVSVLLTLLTFYLHFMAPNEADNHLKTGTTSFHLCIL